MIKDMQLPAGYVISEQELRDFFTESELKRLIPKEAQFISAKPIILDNHRAGVVLFNQTLQRLDISRTVRMQMYVTIVKNKMVFIQFMVASQSPDKELLQAKFQKVEPLFRMMANSFIIQNQYKELDYKATGSLNTASSTKPYDPSDLFSMQNILLSLIITWTVGLLPPVVIRFLVWRKPIKKRPAIMIAGIFWFINFIIFVGVLGSQSKSHFALILIAYVSYRILKYGHKEVPN